MASTERALTRAAQTLRRALESTKLTAPVAYVYNPLSYAWAAHRAYLTAFGSTAKKVLFVGMNPGPFGMVQTGVPFGEIAAVRDWMSLDAPVGRPERLHPKRPVDGFACARSEVSGRRLWGLFASRFGVAKNFFSDHFVVNYCPLAFFDVAGRNLTPDKLTGRQAAKLYAACDEHLRQVTTALQPNWVIGVGDFAEKRARAALDGMSVQFGRILHPSPANPAANRGWSAAATQQLQTLGVW